MGGPYRKLQKNAEKYKLDDIYKNMTPEQYREGVRRAVELATNELAKEYDKQLEKLQQEYNTTIRTSIALAVDTFSVEILYELGNILDCYIDNPENLDQKIDVVQSLYETTMSNIEKYTNYKNDKQARKNFEKKKKIVAEVFGIMDNDYKKK